MITIEVKSIKSNEHFNETEFSLNDNIEFFKNLILKDKDNDIFNINFLEGIKNVSPRPYNPWDPRNTEKTDYIITSKDFDNNISLTFNVENQDYYFGFKIGTLIPIEPSKRLKLSIKFLNNVSYCFKTKNGMSIIKEFEKNEEHYMQIKYNNVMLCF